MDEKPDWPALCPQGHRRSGVAWLATRSVNGQLNQLAPQFLNCLPVPGTILRQGHEAGKLILYSCKFGVLCMSLRAEKEPTTGLIIVHPVFADDSPVITWLEVKPPLEQWKTDQSERDPSIELCVSKRTQSLHPSATSRNPTPRAGGGGRVARFSGPDC